MAAPTDPPDEANRALAYVCRRLDYLRGHLGPESGGGDPSELRALTGLVTARQQPDPGELRDFLEVLDQAVQAAGDPLGVWQASAQWSGQRSLRLAGIPDDIPYEVSYLCPRSRCAGRRRDRFAVEAPVCAITGGPMIRRKL